MHNDEYRRCLIALDVPAMIRLHEHHSPHMPRLKPADALCSMHIARVEMKYLRRNLKQYSRDWLRERGIQKVDGRWEIGEAPPIISDCVGISSSSKYPGVSKKIVRAMGDALDDARAKGIYEPPMQKERMLGARAKVRFRLRMI